MEEQGAVRRWMDHHLSPYIDALYANPHVDRATKQLGSYMDRIVPLVYQRWVVTAALMAMYWLRVYAVGGFYVISYILHIYLLHILLSFLTPQSDESSSSGFLLPQYQSDEYRPFQRLLSELASWKRATAALALSLVGTAFPALDLPVFWPILLVYFVFLFIYTLREQIKMMIRHNYVPFNIGKTQYSKDAPPSKRPFRG